MKKTVIAIATLAAAGILHAQNVTNLFPGGDFASGGSTNWAESQGGGFVFSYPASGGNPGEYAIIDGTNSTTWAVLVAGDATPLTLGSLGLVPGGTYTFLQDMITLAGANTGGLKVESWGPDGLISSSGDMRPVSWTTNGWATYSFTYTVSLSATGLKIVPLWAPASVVGFDNLGVVAPASTPLFAQIISPANSASVSTNFLIVAATGVVPGSVTNVDFYRGATLIGSDTTAPFSLNVSNAALGAEALKVIANDDNGGSVTSAVVNVTVIGGAAPTNTFLVDPAASWAAYMNVRNTPQNGNGYVFDSPWGAGALTAGFSGVGPSSMLTLKPGTAPGDSNPFWLDYTVEPLLSNPTNYVGAVGFKEMEASYYVQVPDGSVSGNVVVFTGTCKTNTLDITLNPSRTNGIGNGWINYAFVKDFAPNYSSSVDSLVTLTSGAPFSVSLATLPDPARHVQYGFVTRGPNVWQTDVDNYGVVQINSLDASPTNVYVNNSSSWGGFMNVFNKPQDGGGYQFGSGWGTADLCAVFNGQGLVLSPNTIGDPNSYWYTPSGGPGAVGNKTMDANMYVEIGSLPGRKLIFSGNVLSNTLVSASNTNALGNGWTSVAFIKDFAPDYSSFNSSTVSLTPGAFSISLNTVNDPARHVQYGFETVGPDVWVTDVAAFGKVIIGNVGTLPTSITASKSGNNVALAFASQLGKAYTVQYKNNLPDASWNTLTTTNGTGASIVISDPSSGSQRFYRLSIQ